MKFKISYIFFIGYVAGAETDEKCGALTECTRDWEARLAAVENAVNAQKLEFDDERKNLLEENAVLKRELESIRQNVDEIESVVLPWKTKASCQAGLSGESRTNL